MSAWPGKYVIGLTGNIATGKSVVRKMLEHLGAYGIDADALVHRAMAPDAPGYPAVIELFGKWVLAPDGQIDRTKLARLVFSDPDALARLEAIIHPLVKQAVDILIRRSRHKVVVIEAIKLLEAGMREPCDTLWVTYAPPETQLVRLMKKRDMDEATAQLRIKTQPPQEQKVAAADVVIQNDGNFEDTWRQVLAAWQTTVPGASEPYRAVKPEKGKLVVQRARPSQAAEIASLINHLSEGQRRLSRDDIMAAFGEKAFLILKMDEKPVGVVGWKVENLVARTDNLYLENSVSFDSALVTLMDEVERNSRELQCEISLLFLPSAFSRHDATLHTLGYQRRTIQSLSMRAWQEAALESMPADSLMLFKQLRQDRVLRPV